MRFIGNYKDWIDPEWISYVLSNKGDGRPAEGQKPNSSEMEDEYRRAKLAGYQDDAIYFWMFDKNNTPFDIVPPFINGPHHWWITKMLPGNFMPMHKDPHTSYEKNSQRFWIPLTDWAPGHIFMYEDQVITNYLSGDVWQYTEAGALHGAANIGHAPRVVLQISTYDQ
jgi:hypothetical protein